MQNLINTCFTLLLSTVMKSLYSRQAENVYNMTNSYVLCTNVHDTLGTPPCAVTLQGCTRV